MAILLLFFDGIGVGEPDPVRNPFAAVASGPLRVLAGARPPRGWHLARLDATLGVPGLPQSATGQTTLFTGVNAARLLGYHQTGIPGPRLCEVLGGQSLFRRLREARLEPTFANAYTRAHLESRRPRWSVTTRMVLSAGVAPRILDGARTPPCLPHDYTGEWFRRRGYPVPDRGAREAAEILGTLLQEHDLVLYEYFLTDLAGHRGDAAEQRLQASRADALVQATAATIDPDRHTVVVVSDHGNLEDTATRGHTAAPVPCLAYGQSARELTEGLVSLEDVTPAILRALDDR